MIEKYWNKVKDWVHCIDCNKPMYLAIIIFLLFVLLVT